MATEQTYVLDGPTDFFFPFPVRTAGQIVVSIEPGGVLPSSSYDVIGASATATGVTIRFVNAPRDGLSTLRIQRRTEPLRVSQFLDDLSITARALNAEFDNILQLVQDGVINEFRGEWETERLFLVLDVIVGPDDNIYVSLEQHESDVFATDLSDGKWLLAADFSTGQTNINAALNAAIAARDKAEQWAQEAEDVEVETGEFSAFHYSIKASDSADAALVSEQNAAPVNAIVGDITTVADIESDVIVVAGINSEVVTVSGIDTEVTTVSQIAADVITVAGIDADVTAVAANQTNVNIVATDIANVNTTGASIADVNTTAANIANVNTVAGIAPNVTTVADIAPNVTTVAAIDTNVTTVAGIDANVSTVAGISGDVTTVSGIASNVTTVAGINADVTTVAGISGNVATVANNFGNVVIVAGIDADVTTVAGISSDVTTVATNVADVTNFSDVYLGPKSLPPTLRNDGSALQVGDLYFDTVAEEMRVFDGSVFVATGSAVNGTSARESFTATANQTTFALAGSHDPGFADVYLNGVKLVNGVDVDVSTGTEIVLTTGAASGDTVDVVAYGSFELANHFTKTEADNRFLPQEDPAFTGTLSGGSASVSTAAVTSTTDATSTTAAPLKSAGGLAVAKSGYFGDFVKSSEYIKGDKQHQVIFLNANVAYTVDLDFDINTRHSYLVFISLGTGAHNTQPRYQWRLGVFIPTAATGVWTEIATGAANTTGSGDFTVAASATAGRLVITKVAGSTAGGIGLSIDSLNGLGWNTFTLNQ